MQELIDRQAALRLCKDADWEDDRIFIAGYNHAIRTMTQAITELPTIDAEPVVRCGECKYMEPNGHCTQFADDKIRPSVSDYCSAGERKNGGAENG